MNQYVKRTQRDYPLSFKLAVVEQVEKGEMTYRQAQDRASRPSIKPRTQDQQAIASGQGRVDNVMSNQHSPLKHLNTYIYIPING
ncbi:hypothetical protein JQS65_12005 [Yersinia enterocolitica subsp. palearctica]|nr:hypothetical protein [Yersinia enterocolitica subsp. palearctica]